MTLSRIPSENEAERYLLALSRFVFRDTAAGLLPLLHERTRQGRQTIADHAASDGRGDSCAFEEGRHGRNSGPDRARCGRIRPEQQSDE